MKKELKMELKGELEEELKGELEEISREMADGDEDGV